MQGMTDWNASEYARISTLQAAMAEEVLSLLALNGTEHILDVGCGNGRYLDQLRKVRHSGPVVGMDLSAGMLSGVKAAYLEQALAQGDAAKLPFRDGCADVALAMHMLYHVPSPERAVAELRRVVRPGGRALVILNGRDGLAECYAQALRTLVPGVLLRQQVQPDRQVDPYLALVGAGVAVQRVADFVEPGLHGASFGLPAVGTGVSPSPLACQ